MRARRVFISSIAIIMALQCLAYDFVADGNAYRINSDGKTLTLNGFVGDLDTLKNFVIPDYVVYNDVSYPVIDVDYTWSQEVELDDIYFGRHLQYIYMGSFVECGTVKHVIWNAKNCFVYDIITAAPINRMSMGERSIERGVAGLNTVDVETLIIGEDVETLPYPFMIGAKIRSLHIPSSVRDIDGFAFYSCEELNAVTVAEDNPYYDSREGCNGVVRTADNTLVLACSTTDIPTSVTAISSRAFLANLTAKEINLPSSISKIESDAFRYCTQLEKITVNNPNPNDITLGLDVFGSEGMYNEWSGIPIETCVLYVPKGSVQLYKNANQWKKFKHIEEINYYSSIDDMNAVPVAGDGAYYDMQGRRVAEPSQPGIYVRDGKKIVVK
ncbi:MAG: leucine-rich repeat protein [Muribaculaceae bacterium]|nr:leucine-rich repeat protein [Muribaculaceae bacterium]